MTQINDKSKSEIMLHYFNLMNEKYEVLLEKIDNKRAEIESKFPKSENQTDVNKSSNGTLQSA